MIEAKARATRKKQAEGPPELTQGRAKAVSPAATVEKLIHGGHRTELSKSPASAVRANEAQHTRVKKQASGGPNGLKEA